MTLFFPEYFLEDCIQMTNFVPPPMDRKKKDKDEEGGEDDVSVFFHLGPVISAELLLLCNSDVPAALCGPFSVSFQSLTHCNFFPSL